MPLLLGIDIGTSSAKAVLFDSDSASIVATAGREYPIHRPAPDRAEQNPEDWWNAAVDVTRRVVTQSGRADIAAISLCGQMHGGALVDAKGIPLGNAIIWADQRAVDEVRELVALLGAERYTAIAGTLPAVGFLGGTLLWLKKHHPERLDQVRAVLFPKDYVRYRLTGVIATDVSDAAASALFDVKAARWSSEIIGAAGLPEAIFPTPLASTAIAGTLMRAAADALGLRADIPVIAGCADQPAQAVANGLIQPGRASVTVGSGGQVCNPIASADKTDARLHVFNHAAPDMWYVLGATLSAGLSLRWLRGIVGLSGDAAYATFSAEAAAIPAGANGLIFLPHLAGERTPHMDARARGAFIGLSAFHTRGHLARAVMEGVAFSLRSALQISLELGGAADMIIAAGGAMESDVWRGIVADALGLPLRRTLLTETTGVGAALLAGVGAGVYPDLAAACARTARYDSVTEPDAARGAIYAELYEQYLGLYPKLQMDFHRLALMN
ncbi:MAG: xylulokinase, partial [Chloroflexota bacterium]|nr:xylulokinase [Chloroflexota bacterium]